MGAMVEIPGQMIALEEKSIIGSLYGSANMKRDMPRLIELYKGKKIKLDELVSKRIKLDQVNDAFADMEKGAVARSVIVF
jgi:Zn-dependent alcohol dehydrogenase